MKVLTQNRKITQNSQNYCPHNQIQGKHDTSDSYSNKSVGTRDKRSEIYREKTREEFSTTECMFL